MATRDLLKVSLPLLSCLVAGTAIADDLTMADVAGRYAFDVRSNEDTSQANGVSSLQAMSGSVGRLELAADGTLTGTRLVTSYARLTASEWRRGGVAQTASGTWSLGPDGLGNAEIAWLPRLPLVREVACATEYPSTNEIVQFAADGTTLHLNIEMTLEWVLEDPAPIGCTSVPNVGLVEIPGVFSGLATRPSAEAPNAARRHR